MPTLLDFDIEQAALQSLLRSGTPPVIEVSGPLGAGKTALVRRIPGALYVDAGGLSYRAFLQRLYESAFATEGVYAPSIEALRSAFQRWRAPVIIDDFEGSVSELHEVLKILERVPVIYTTVEPLEIEPSAEFRLSGLRPDTAYKLFEHYYGASIDGEHAVMELVSIYLEGNPLMIAQAGALARARGLTLLQGPEPLAAAIFNNMTIGEQQILATIAGYKETRPERKMVEVVSGIRGASATISSLIARHAVETDGERLWLSPLVSYPVEAVLPSLIRYDAMFAYADSMLSHSELPRSVVENPAPFVLTLRLAVSRGCHAQAARNGRVLLDALLLAGSIDAAYEVCAVVREAANEVGDQVMRAWAHHQSGVVAALMGDREEAASHLKSAVLLRERIGDLPGKACSEKNLALFPHDRLPHRRKKQRSFIGAGDLLTIACAMVLAVVAALGYVGNWRPQHVAKQMHIVKTHSERAMVAQQPAKKPAPPAVAMIRPPRIVRFDTNTERIKAGQFASLCYEVSGAKAVYLIPLGTADIGRQSCIHVSPHMNTRYTLFASNADGVASASVRVEVMAQEATRVQRKQLLGGLDFAYRIRGSRAFWPNRVYSDGMHTFIELRQPAQRAPVLFTLRNDGVPEETSTFHYSGNLLVIDGTPPAMELVLSKDGGRISIKHL